jgi:hypothetical protein
VYRWFLETFYGLKISDMYIMIFHPDNDNFKRYRLNRMDDEVNKMIAERLQVVQSGGKKVCGSTGEYGFTD